MYVMPPRQTGDYRNREFDCQEAIEPIFLEVWRNSRPFVDLARIKAAALPLATDVGWCEDEVQFALLELARCYVMSVKPLNA